MRQRQRGGSGAERDIVARLLEEEQLDEAEQQALVAALERTHAAQSRAWRLTFGALGAAMGLLLLWFAAGQAAHPWVGHRHHSAFHRSLPAGGVAAAEAASGLTCLAGAAALLSRGVLPPHRRSQPQGLPSAGGAAVASRGVAPRAPALELRLASAALAAAGAMAALWGAALRVSFVHHRVDGGQVVRLLWLPAAPLGYALLVWAVLRMMRGTEAELRALRGQMYTFHKA